MARMFLRPRRAAPLWSILLALGALAAGVLTAAPAGPTLHFDYGRGQPQANPLGAFMYFVPLISPEGVSVHTNVGNTQCARVVSFHCRTNSTGFHAVCEFDFVGEGMQRNVFDHTAMIHRHEEDLAAGKTLAHQLNSIDVAGAGLGTMEIDGAFTNGRPVVAEMRLRFNAHGHPSPVSVDLQDISMKNGALLFDHEIVARVNALTFRHKEPPKMEVTLASVKRANAGNSRWQNFLGDLEGAAANFLLPPIRITGHGQSNMMDFGLALATEQPAFTFPYAERLTNGVASEK
jgi:hypothetical protein